MTEEKTSVDAVVADTIGNSSASSPASRALTVCTECKGLGDIVMPHFNKCEMCAGMGGITCTLCNGHIWIVQHGKAVPCHACDRGFTELCKMCLGSRAYIDARWKVQCPTCRRQRRIITPSKSAENLSRASPQNRESSEGLSRGLPPKSPSSGRTSKST